MPSLICLHSRYDMRLAVADGKLRLSYPRRSAIVSSPAAACTVMKCQGQIGVKLLLGLIQI